MSCLLFHGPGARQTSLNYVEEMGRLLAPPFGDEGLKVDDSREIKELLSYPPVGEAVGYVILGPMEQATPEAVDGLLKNIEEFPEGVQPLLWAHDLGDVSPIIRSRCLDRWCPLLEEGEEDESLITLGYDLVDAALAGENYRVALLLGKKKEEKEDSLKGVERELLGVLADVLSTDLNDPKRLALWERVRKAAVWYNPTRLGIVAALLE